MEILDFKGGDGVAFADAIVMTCVALTFGSLALGIIMVAKSWKSLHKGDKAKNKDSLCEPDDDEPKDIYEAYEKHMKSRKGNAAGAIVSVIGWILIISSGLGLFILLVLKDWLANIR